jgi:hypothetical protein
MRRRFGPSVDLNRFDPFNQGTPRRCGWASLRLGFPFARWAGRPDGRSTHSTLGRAPSEDAFLPRLARAKATFRNPLTRSCRSVRRAGGGRFYGRASHCRLGGEVTSNRSTVSSKGRLTSCVATDCTITLPIRKPRSGDCAALRQSAAALNGSLPRAKQQFLIASSKHRLSPLARSAWRGRPSGLGFNRSKRSSRMYLPCTRLAGSIPGPSRSIGPAPRRGP